MLIITFWKTHNVCCCFVSHSMKRFCEKCWYPIDYHGLEVCPVCEEDEPSVSRRPLSRVLLALAFIVLVAVLVAAAIYFLSPNTSRTSPPVVEPRAEGNVGFFDGIRNVRAMRNAHNQELVDALRPDGAQSPVADVVSSSTVTTPTISSILSAEEQIEHESSGTTVAVAAPPAEVAPVAPVVSTGSLVSSGVLVKKRRPRVAPRVVVAPSTIFVPAVVPIHGSGSAADPYIIEELGHLAWLSAQCTLGNEATRGKHYRMVRDIDGSVTKKLSPEESASASRGRAVRVRQLLLPIGMNMQGQGFCGFFDGNGKVVTNVHISMPEFVTGVGLFGCVSSGEVRHLGIENSSFWGSNSVGSLVGLNQNGVVRDCYALGSTVLGKQKVGGLVGYNNGSVSNSYASVLVEGRDYTGGFAGLNIGRVANCFWDTKVSGISRSDAGLGFETRVFSRREIFKGWDFADVWELASGSVYPRFRRR